MFQIHKSLFLSIYLYIYTYLYIYVHLYIYVSLSMYLSIYGERERERGRKSCHKTTTNGNIILVHRWSKLAFRGVTVLQDRLHPETWGKFLMAQLSSLKLTSPFARRECIMFCRGILLVEKKTEMCEKTSSHPKPGSGLPYTFSAILKISGKSLTTTLRLWVGSSRSVKISWKVTLGILGQFIAFLLSLGSIHSITLLFI